MTHSEMRCYFISQHKLAGEGESQGSRGLFIVFTDAVRPLDSAWLWAGGCPVRWSQSSEPSPQRLPSTPGRPLRPVWSLSSLCDASLSRVKLR